MVSIRDIINDERLDDYANYISNLNYTISRFEKDPISFDFKKKLEILRYTGMKSPYKLNFLDFDLPKDKYLFTDYKKITDKKKEEIHKKITNELAKGLTNELYFIVTCKKPSTNIEYIAKFDVLLNFENVYRGLKDKINDALHYVYEDTSFLIDSYYSYLSRSNSNSAFKYIWKVWASLLDNMGVLLNSNVKNYKLLYKNLKEANKAFEEKRGDDMTSILREMCKLNNNLDLSAFFE